MNQSECQVSWLQFPHFDTMTSLMSLANHNKCRKANEPIRMPSQPAKISHALIQGHLRSQVRKKSVLLTGVLINRKSDTIF